MEKFSSIAKLTRVICCIKTRKATPTGYTIGLTGGGYFYIRSSKQALVSTSSTHAEMREIYTLVKDLLFLIYMCYELRVELHLPALVFEDSSAVVTVTKEENAHAKKCKHFLMVINYVKEQIINLGLIDQDRQDRRDKEQCRPIEEEIARWDISS